ncbi:MAG: ornithine cyclodeaminase [Gammaproteobacteria bacterium]|nr:ornithine cyclodeaminase [Gammaproteobacteria bacterium]
MLLLEVPVICEMVKTLGLKQFYLRLCEYLSEDFSHWDKFQKTPRHALYVPDGVMELMPICNDTYYTFKYVNGHPLNPLDNKLNIVAFGMLAEVATGLPLMVASMTLLTGLRTAATSALASKYLAKQNSKRLAIIGCGAQSEFQVLAHHALFDLSEVHYFDIDTAAMARFADHLKDESFTLHPADSARSALEEADIIVTTTAAKGKQKVIEQAWLQLGQHISAVGGDSPGKTELDPDILTHAKVVIEYFPQTVREGELQNLGERAKDYVYAELWEIISDKKPGREHDQEISLYDSVGFAIEDFSILRLCYQLAEELHLGKHVHLIPEQIADSKNLFGLLMGESQ